MTVEGNERATASRPILPLSTPELDLAERVRSARASEHQVAGHDGILSTDDGLIFKPSTTNEVNFYNIVKEKHLDMLEFMPKFYGVLPLEQNGKSLENCIALENVLHRFRKPSVMDIKLGTQLYDEFCSESKKERMREAAASTTSLQLGFRITGIKVHNPSSGEYVEYDKFFGKNLTPDNVNSGFINYFEGAKAHSQDYHRNVILSFIVRLQGLQKIMVAKEFRMYASSILFVYEGEPTAEEATQAARVTDLRTIDFAHSYYIEGQGVDEGHLLGMKNTMDQLERLILNE